MKQFSAWTLFILIAVLSPAFLSLTLTLVQAQDSFSSQLQPHVTVAPNRPGQTIELKPQSRPTTDTFITNEATVYLHQHRLPYAEATVFRGAPRGSLSVTLTGQVRTQFGKEDAERKVARFLNSDVPISNQLIVNADLSATTVRQPDSRTQNSGDILVLPTQQQSDIAKQNSGFLEGCWQGTFNDTANLRILDAQTALLHEAGRCPIVAFIVSYRFCARNLDGVENISTYDSLISAPGTYGYKELEKHGSFDAQSGKISLVIAGTMRTTTGICVVRYPVMYKYTRTLMATISYPKSLRATFGYEQFYSRDGSNWSPLFASSDTEEMFKQ